MCFVLLLVNCPAMRKPERFRLFLDYFTTHFPEPETELIYTNPYELIVAVVLSAQCTDKRVNQVMPALLEFARERISRDEMPAGAACGEHIMA